MGLSDRSDLSDLSDQDVLGVLHDAATAVRVVLDELPTWGLAGTKDGQYTHDLAADEAALAVLRGAGFSVLSEESGPSGSAASQPGGPLVVLDPVDGSTNASRGIPWWNTSLCALDDSGMRAAVVVDQSRDVRYSAVRGEGAFCSGRAVRPSSCERVDAAVLGLNGYPPHHLGWKQYRALGAAALDLCAVADGILDGYVDCTRGGLSPWDYLGGALVCLEAGASVAALDGDLVARGFDDRRIIVAAATPSLLESLLALRRGFS